MTRHLLWPVVLTWSAFMLWMIYLADTGGDSVFLTLTRAVPMGDKVGHFVFFGVLTFGLNLALRGRTVVVAGRSVYAGTLAVAVFAVAEELSQAWFPARTLDARDLVADALGIALFSWLSGRVWRGHGVNAARVGVPPRSQPEVGATAAKAETRGGDMLDV